MLRELVAHDDWLADTVASPDPQFYRQYLLYCDPAARFSVVSFVWGPAQRTPIHNHTVWGLIGLLRGTEITQACRAGPGGTLAAAGAPQRLEAGSVAAVSPTLGDIHPAFNAFADQISIAIHVYGADIGAVDRSTFTLDGAMQAFRSGYSGRGIAKRHHRLDPGSPGTGARPVAQLCCTAGTVCTCTCRRGPDGGAARRARAG